jgi:hypothetical protein
VRVSQPEGVPCPIVGHGRSDVQFFTKKKPAKRRAFQGSGV